MRGITMTFVWCVGLLRFYACEFTTTLCTYNFYLRVSTALYAQVYHNFMCVGLYLIEYMLACDFVCVVVPNCIQMRAHSFMCVDASLIVYMQTHNFVHMSLSSFIYLWACGVVHMDLTFFVYLWAGTQRCAREPLLFICEHVVLCTCVLSLFCLFMGQRCLYTSVFYILVGL